MSILESILDFFIKGSSVEPLVSKEAQAMFKNLSDEEITKMYESNDRGEDQVELTGKDETKYIVCTVGRMGVSVENGKIKSIKHNGHH